MLVDSAGPEVGGSHGVAVARLHLEYDGLVGPAFSWLFLAAGALAGLAARAGWTVELLDTEPGGRYLARLQRPSSGAG